MKIRIDDLRGGALRLAGTVAAPRSTAPDGVDLGAPIAFSIAVDAEATTIRVTGWLHSVPRVPCARCLEPVALPVERDLELSYVPAAAGADGDTELDARDLDTDYYDDAGLELAAMLAEQVLLDLPMKPLCGEECRGICPQCGTNRNAQPCDCEPATDPRLSPLAALRKQL